MQPTSGRAESGHKQDPYQPNEAIDIRFTDRRRIVLT